VLGRVKAGELKLGSAAELLGVSYRQGKRLWGLWSRERKRRQHRRRRERKEHFGELVQLDGSFEEWLPESGEKQCLMNMVDDATGKTLSQLHPQETTWAPAGVLRGWVEPQISQISQIVFGFSFTL